MKTTRHDTKALMVLVTAVFMMSNALAGDIISLKDGYLTFLTPDTNLYYTVEARPNFTGSYEDWEGIYRIRQDIRSTNSMVTVPVGFFYRIVANPQPLHTRTISPGSKELEAGYYEATTLDGVDPNLSAENILAGSTLFGIEGAVLQATGDATAAEVLTGSTFSRADAVNVSGTMPNRGAQNVMPGATAQAILQGYHDGTGEVAGDADLVAGNIKASVSIFGVDGTVVESTGDAEAGQVLTGATFSKAGEAGLTGTMPDQGGRGFMPDVADVTIPAGYYSGEGVVTGDAALVTGNIRAGATVFGVEGKPEVVDTEDATAVAADVMEGKVAFVAGSAVTGTIAMVTLSDTTTVVQAGYYAATNLALVDADLATDNIRAGVTLFGMPGTVLQATGDAEAAEVLTGRTFSRVDAVDVTGTMTNVGQQNMTPSTEAQAILQGYHDGTGEVAGDPNLVAANIREGVSIFGVTGKGMKSGMALIPAGEFVKTDYPDGSNWVTNYISAFYMSRTEITQAQWDEVYVWATNNGYAFDSAGQGKALDHPVHMVNWYDTVKWCNARSEMEGRIPAYYTDGTHATVYRTGNLDLTNACVKWTTGGYRLPTETEWEKAARGGLEAHRFPWAHTWRTNQISHFQANFRNNGGETYQYATTGWHPDYNDATMPYTSPVGSFAPNGYGLYDMAGNVRDRCWDRYQLDGYFSEGSNPRGPDDGIDRTYRGGHWHRNAAFARISNRGYYDPAVGDSVNGFRVVLPSSDMVLIPAGDFIKTDHPDGSNWTTNYISAFYMSRHHVTKALWDEVYVWATNNGYAFDIGGWGKETDHPVYAVKWFDVVKWCNARSEMEGRTPAYYTDGTHVEVYRTGHLHLTNASVKWTMGGYRLPTEAEWEKAARGGLEAHRFPWGDTISHGQANFNNKGGEAYQYGTTGYHPDYNDGTTPYTSPVGSFAPNGYGLYDMAGNVLDWCWDRHGAAGGYYVAGSDLRGPDADIYRVLRGGGWIGSAYGGRSAYRGSFHPNDRLTSIGFRVALTSGQ